MGHSPPRKRLKLERMPSKFKVSLQSMCREHILTCLTLPELFKVYCLSSRTRAVIEKNKYILDLVNPHKFEFIKIEKMKDLNKLFYFLGLQNCLKLFCENSPVKIRKDTPELLKKEGPFDIVSLIQENKIKLNFRYTLAKEWIEGGD